jgi:inner membrane protein YidH
MDKLAPVPAKANIGNELAWMNTMFGLQRTLMAADRTAVTLIGFGFTVAQLFQNLKSELPTRLQAIGAHTPRDVGLLMIAAGVGWIALFTWEYVRAVRYLDNEPFADLSVRVRMPLHQLSCAAGFAIMFIGILAFGSVFVTF